MSYLGTIIIYNGYNQLLIMLCLRTNFLSVNQKRQNLELTTSQRPTNNFYHLSYASLCLKLQHTGFSVDFLYSKTFLKKNKTLHPYNSIYSVVLLLRYSPEPNCRDGGGLLSRGVWYFTTNL